MKRRLSFVLIVSAIAMMTMVQSCKKATVPELTTAAVTEVTLNTAVSGGTITKDGGEDILEKGVCWSTTASPTIADQKTTNGKGSDSFVSNLGNLTEGTPYFVRAYATNSVGTGYGNEVTFTTNQVTGAALTTNEATSITSTTAVAGGNVTSAGGGTITERGVCWGTSQNPTVSDNKTPSGTGIGIFTSNLTNLSNGTVYYYRAYANNSSGTTYGQQFHFITPVTDIEGNVYKTVKIGDQVWMAENLKTTRYTDDAIIPNITENDDWIALTSDAYCWAKNEEDSYKSLYGALYNWFAVESGQLCPTGWHVPTDADFIKLEVSLGMNETDAAEEKYRGTDQGSQLKNTSGWDKEGNGTNSSGFSALPSGYRYYDDGSTKGLGLICYFWSSDGVDVTNAVYRRLDGDNAAVYRGGTHKQAGKSVRCVKN